MANHSEAPPTAPDPEPAWVQMSCGCCPPSERWWFRWVMLGQPVLAATIIAFNHFAGN